MNRPRLSMAKMMAIVGIVAFNIAAVRALLSSRMELAFGLTPIGILLQVALLKAIRHQGRSRFFWAGFSILGTAAAASFIWAAFFDKSWLGIRWYSYTLSANAFLRLYLPGLGLSMFSPNKLIIIATVVIICFAPQLAAALIGGLSGLLIANHRSSGVRRLGVAAGDPTTRQGHEHLGHGRHRE